MPYIDSINNYFLVQSNFSISQKLRFDVGYIAYIVAKVIIDFRTYLDTYNSIDQTKLDQINGSVQ